MDSLNSDNSSMEENNFKLPTMSKTVKGFAKVGNSLVMTGADLDVLNVALGTTPLTLEGSMWLGVD